MPAGFKFSLSHPKHTSGTGSASSLGKPIGKRDRRRAFPRQLKSEVAQQWMNDDGNCCFLLLNNNNSDVTSWELRELRELWD